MANIAPECALDSMGAEASERVECENDLPRTSVWEQTHFSAVSVIDAMWVAGAVALCPLSKDEGEATGKDSKAPTPFSTPALQPCAGVLPYPTQS